VKDGLKGGFILIEVILGTAIAAIIFSSLTGILYQVNRGGIRTDNTISLYSRLSLARYLLTRDLLGTTIPCQADVVQEALEQEKKKQKTPAPKMALGQQAEKKEEKKPITHLFFGALSQQQKMLTFITNNPMQVYWSARAGRPKPCVARVVYTLVPEPGRPNAFNLMRQEGTELEFEKYKEKGMAGAVREYEVITGVRSMETSFVYALLPEKEKEPKGILTQQFQQPKTPPAKKEIPKLEFKEVPLWEIKKNEEREKERKPILPNAVKFTIDLWDEQYLKSRTFSFAIPLPASQAQQMQQAMMQFAPAQQPPAQAKPADRPGLMASSSPIGLPPRPSARRRPRRSFERPPIMFTVADAPQTGMGLS